MTPTFKVRSGKREGFVEIVFAEKPEDRSVTQELRDSGFRFKRGDGEAWWWGKRDHLPNQYRGVPLEIVAAPVAAASEPVAESEVSVREPKTLKVAGVGKHKNAEVNVIREVKGLALHDALGGRGFTITHAASGMALGKSYKDITDKELAEKLLVAVADVTDWTQDAAALKGQAAHLKVVLPQTRASVEQALTMQRSVEEPEPVEEEKPVTLTVVPPPPDRKVVNVPAPALRIVSEPKRAEIVPLPPPKAKEPTDEKPAGVVGTQWDMVLARLKRGQAALAAAQG